MLRTLPSCIYLFVLLFANNISLILESNGCEGGKNAEAAGRIRGLDDTLSSEDEWLRGMEAEAGAPGNSGEGGHDERDELSFWRWRKHHHRRRGLSPLEKVFAAQPSRISARENLKFLAQNPHMAGTEQDGILGEWMKVQFKKLGADDAWVDPVDAFLSYPRFRPRLALMGSNEFVYFEAKLSEDILSSDATSDTIYRNHTFNGYARSGNVRGRLVYANFGTPEDFDVLKKFNVTVRNSIVLMRYGKCFRGLKAMNAQMRGAVGAVIFSDPHEDGYSVGPTYPNGPWRPASSVQRGSVQFNSLCAGDPRRTASNDTFEKCGYLPGDLVPRIPVLPISYEDALPLLRDLEGPFSPPEFVGTLQVAYKLGPSAHLALLSVKNQYSIEKIYNTFAIFKGVHHGTKRDRPLVIGNHRDAWVFGKE